MYRLNDFQVNSDANGYISLCYHYIRPDKKDPFPRILGTKTNEFKKQLTMLEQNFKIISFDEALKFSYEKNLSSIKKIGVLITFDDGLSDHFLAAKILAEHNIKSIFFIPTCILKDELPANPIIIHYGIALFGLEQFLIALRSALKKNKLELEKFNVNYVSGRDNVWKKIDETKSIFKYRLDYKKSRDVLLHIYENLILTKYPDIIKKMHVNKKQVKEMIEMGHTIGAHTHTHISVAVTSLSKKDFYKEMIFPKKYFESEFNIPINSFSYPFGEKKDCLSAAKFLKKTNEYKLAFTVNEIMNFYNTSPLELGRFQPHSNDDADSIRENMLQIIKESIAQ